MVWRVTRTRYADTHGWRPVASENRGEATRGTSGRLRGDTADVRCRRPTSFSGDVNEGVNRDVDRTDRRLGAVLSGPQTRSASVAMNILRSDIRCARSARYAYAVLSDPRRQPYRDSCTPSPPTPAPKKRWREPLHIGQSVPVGNREGASHRPTGMRRYLICSALMMLFASCARNDEASTPTSAEDGIQVSVPETTTGGSGISSEPSVSMPRSSSTASSSAVSLVEVTSDCGPTDGNWVRGALTSSDTQSVFAQLSVDGATYGRSDVVVLEAGVETTVGFDPQRPNEAFGKVGQFEVVHAETGVVIASSDVLLKIPDGVSCG